MSPAAGLEPFRFVADAADLADLRDRLRRTRWPEPATVGGWEQGMPLDALRTLCGRWADGYEWRRAERWLNEAGARRTRIDGLDLHLLHVRSPHRDATPLLLTHGWPGSVLEFRHVMAPLADPTAHGGRAQDAFHVVAPSLPGYGFSARPDRPGWGIRRIAAAWAELMTRLGYERFGAAGGDWGTSITTVLALTVPERLIGIHLAPPLVAPDPATFDDLTAAERAAVASLAHARDQEDGYTAEQATKPQTIGYALLDSPVALAAWVGEKYETWTDGGLASLPTDELLDTLTLYWLTGTGASAARLYWESIAEVQTWFTSGAGDVVTVPTGCSVFPAETIRPSLRWARRRFADIRWWGEPPRGGHFPAWEQPALYVHELRSAFAAFRG
ncbi:epoxide hydrolase family protein [Cellulomonas edaphi]|uniref:Epoxide hydrolase n=1 Tax=Cellulomonas edaphi TaxID=3053468 RepID=A0ABT7S3I6_9CELL|nr:epoxide hydrolase family protein [Cellulomons edaphi]MDM7830094.1 epoxide hydrolase [Cellulomons edaphi]